MERAVGVGTASRWKWEWYSGCCRRQVVVVVISIGRAKVVVAERWRGWFSLSRHDGGNWHGSDGCPRWMAPSRGGAAWELLPDEREWWNGRRVEVIVNGVGVDRAKQWHRWLKRWMLAVEAVEVA